MKRVFIYSMLTAIASATFAQNDNYKTKYQEIEKLEWSNQLKQAAAIADSILNDSRINNHYVDYAKAAIYKIKFAQALEDIDQNEVYSIFKNLRNTAPEESKSVLWFCEANLLSGYYFANRWDINQRLDDKTDKLFLEQMSKAEIVRATTVALNSAIEMALKFDSPLDKYSDFFSDDTYYRQYIPKLTDQIYYSAIDLLSRLDSETHTFAPNDLHSIGDNPKLNEINRQILKWFDSWKTNANQANVTGFIELTLLQYLQKIDDSFDDNSYYEDTFTKLSDEYKGNSILADIKLFVAQHYRSMSGHYRSNEPKTLRYYPYLEKAHNLAKDIMQEFPDSEPAEQAKAMIHGIENPQLTLETNSKEVAGQNFAIALTYTNVTKVKIALKSVSGLDYLNIGRHAEKLKEETVWEQDFDLPKAKDYYKRTTNIVIPYSKPGTYVIEIIDGDKQIEHPLRQAVNLTKVSVFVQQEGEKASYKVVDRFTGEPINKAELTFYNSQYRYPNLEYTVLSKHEVKNGSVTIDDKQQNNFKTVSVSVAGDTLWEQLPVYFNVPQTPKANTRLTLLTDRGIYRPGQTVHLKGIAFNGAGDDYKVEKGLKVELSARDANYKEVATYSATTNDFGSFQLSVPIPENVRPGHFSINSKYGAISFQIESYRRYTFDAEFKAPDIQALPGEDVEIVLKAKTYSGMELSQLAVKGEVSLRSRMFYWMQLESKVITVIDTVADENGEVKIRFNTKQNSEYQGYSIKLTVTAASGESREYQYNYAVSQNPYSINLSSSKILQGDPSPKLLISNINGGDLSEQTTIKISRLEFPQNILLKNSFTVPDEFIYSEQEWKKLMPLYEYNNDLDKTKLPTKETVWTFTGNPADAILPDKFTGNLKEGVYRVELEVRGTKSETYLTVVEPKKKNLAYPEILDVLVNTTVIEAGSQLVCTFVTSVDNARIWYGITAGNKKFDQKSITLKQAKHQIVIPVTDEHEGTIYLNVCMPYGGKIVTKTVEVKVTRKSRELKIETLSMRSPLLPASQEEWSFRISAKDGRPLKAEVIASMYDESLDAFTPPAAWNIPIYYPVYNRTSIMNANSNHLNASQNRLPVYVEPPSMIHWYFFGLSDFSNSYGRYSHKGFYPAGSGDNTMLRKSMAREEMMSERPSAQSAPMDMDIATTATSADAETFAADAETVKPVQNVQMRTNFNETAFFYPTLYNDMDGKIDIKFQTPDALTSWKLRIMGHDKTMASGYFEATVQTRKPVMVIPIFPRFAYTGDSLTINATVFNQTDSTLTIEANAEVSDVKTEAKLGAVINNRQLTIEAGKEATFSVSIKVPEHPMLLQARLMVTAGDFTDGEENIIPVYIDRQYVTNALALWGKPDKTTLYGFDNFAPSNDNPENQHKLTLELSTNPTWYAVQSLPSFDNPNTNSPLDLIETVFAALMGDYMVEQYPKIAQAITVWQKYQPDALQSKLSANPELKITDIEQTPWYNDALSDEAQMRRLSMFLDKNNLTTLIDNSIKSLQQLQHASGGFSWRSGFRPSVYITMNVVELIARIVNTNSAALNRYPMLQAIARDGLKFLKTELEQEYKLLTASKSDTSKHVSSYSGIRYFYLQILLDGNYRPASAAEQFYFKKAKDNAAKYNLFGQATLGAVLRKMGDIKEATSLLKGFEGRAVASEEKGMFWRENIAGWEWYQSPMPTHVRIMEFYSIMQASTDKVEAMKIWLLQQKRTKRWSNNSSTADAIYALISTGAKWLNNNKPVTVTLSNLKIISSDYDQIFGTGYFKTTFSKAQIPANISNITIDNPNSNPVYGGIYSQFYENFENIKPSQTNLTISDEYFVFLAGDKAMELAKVEDGKIPEHSKVRVRLTITSDRELDYVMVQLPLAACFEQANQMSGFKRDYYIQNFDNRSEFYLYHLKQGVTVLEIDLKTLRGGVYKLAPVQVQSMYAPEFAAHGKGGAVRVLVTGNR